MFRFDSISMHKTSEISMNEIVCFRNLLLSLYCLDYSDIWKLSLLLFSHTHTHTHTLYRLLSSSSENLLLLLISSTFISLYNHHLFSPWLSFFLSFSSPNTLSLSLSLISSTLTPLSSLFLLQSFAWKISIR